MLVAANLTEQRDELCAGGSSARSGSKTVLVTVVVTL
jgi:hypothetical protein